MPLIACPDCYTEISDLAPTCVKCGRPMHRAVITPGQPSRTQTVELTGKMWKGVQLAGALIMLFGFASCFATFADNIQAEERTRFANVGVQSWFWGFGIWVVGKVGGWWNHG